MNPRYVGAKRIFYCDACNVRITANPFTYCGGPHSDELFICCSLLCMMVHRKTSIIEESKQPSMYLVT